MNLKKSHLLFASTLAVALLSSGAAMADDYSSQPAPQTQSTLTRAQVRAEVLRARADGTLEAWSNEIYGDRIPAASHASTLTRSQVQAELRRAQANGEHTLAEQTYGVVTQPSASERTRAEVRAEARAAARSPRSDIDYGG